MRDAVGPENKRIAENSMVTDQKYESNRMHVRR